MATEQDKDESKAPRLQVQPQGRSDIVLVGVVIGLVITGCWIFWCFARTSFFAQATATEEAARFGESFGGLNTLFSGWAFVAVVIAIGLQQRSIKMQTQSIELQSEAIRLQYEELKLQRQELEDTRAELKKSADAQRTMVSLATLDTLTDYYDRECRNNQDVKRWYDIWSLWEPARLPRSPMFKLRKCTALLEDAYNQATGDTLGETDSFDQGRHRLLLWLQEFGRAISKIDEIKSINGQPGIIMAKNLLDAAKYLNDLNAPEIRSAVPDNGALSTLQDGIAGLNKLVEWLPTVNLLDPDMRRKFEDDLNRELDVLRLIQNSFRF